MYNQKKLAQHHRRMAEFRPVSKGAFCNIMSIGGPKINGAVVHSLRRPSRASLAVPRPSRASLPAPALTRDDDGSQRQENKRTAVESHSNNNNTESTIVHNDTSMILPSLRLPDTNLEDELKKESSHSPFVDCVPKINTDEVVRLSPNILNPIESSISVSDPSLFPSLAESVPIVPETVPISASASASDSASMVMPSTTSLSHSMSTGMLTDLESSLLSQSMIAGSAENKEKNMIVVDTSKCIPICHVPALIQLHIAIRPCIRSILRCENCSSDSFVLTNGGVPLKIRDDPRGPSFQFECKSWEHEVLLYGIQSHPKFNMQTIYRTPRLHTRVAFSSNIWRSNTHTDIPMQFNFEFGFTCMTSNSFIGFQWSDTKCPKWVCTTRCNNELNETIQMNTILEHSVFDERFGARRMVDLDIVIHKEEESFIHDDGDDHKTSTFHSDALFSVMFYFNGKVVCKHSRCKSDKFCLPQTSMGIVCGVRAFPTTTLPKVLITPNPNTLWFQWMRLIATMD